MRIATIVGNRPQFVKAAAVSHLLREAHEEILVHTGQHYDDELSKIFFEELDIPRPNRQLGLGTGTNTAQTARMIAALEPEIREIAPDMVLVYGDTNTTLAAAIVARQLGVALAHIEAGMRSFDRGMPEEYNRVLTDHSSDLLLCSTPVAVQNLGREGLVDGVHLVGDVMADVALAFLPLAEQRSTILDDHGLQAAEYFLVTAHRAGNVDDPARLLALVEVLEALPARIVFPVHPRTRARLGAARLFERLDSAPHVELCAPVGYLDLLKLARHARAVVTDSGGLQKESYVLGTPCVTLRDATEWVETVDAGWNVLVDLSPEAALRAVQASPPDDRPDLYGGGLAGQRVCDAIAAEAAGVS